MQIQNIPKSRDQLLLQAREIAGLRLKDIAALVKTTLPEDLLHAKGHIGQIIEAALGATAGSKARHDFEHLGIELKTIPLQANGQAKESTYVCTVPLVPEPYSTWEKSWVCNKLHHVLWLPLEAEKNIPIAERRIGQAILLELNKDDEAILKSDWEEHMEKISFGRIDEISAHQGQYLQIRPKAANRDMRTRTTDQNGNETTTLPRGFYLRTKYTNRILRNGI